MAEDAELHRSQLQYFMEQFYGIIRNADSNNKELSIAIRGYGLFAGVCFTSLLYFMFLVLLNYLQDYNTAFFK